MNPELKEMLVEPYKIVLSLLNLPDQNRFKWLTSDAFYELNPTKDYYFNKGLGELRNLLLRNDILVLSQAGKFVVIKDQEIIEAPIFNIHDF